MTGRFTNEEKQFAAERELKFRRKVYDNYVNLGNMTRQFADRQIAIMAEIAEDYARLAKSERLF